MRPLSGLDDAFLCLEAPRRPMHVAAVCLFDASEAAEPHRLEAVGALVASRLHLVPAFTQRLVEMPLGLEHPVWIEDPDFDLDRHLVGITIPGGTERDLADLAARVVARPLDRRRPLWELWFVDGLAGGRVATVTKVHHAAIDGIAGTEVLVNLLDFTREPIPVQPRPRTPECPPPPWVRAVRTAAGLGARAARLPRLAGEVAGLVAALRRRNREPGVVPPPSPFSAPRTPLNGPVGAERTVGFASLRFPLVREVKEVLGVKTNDVVLGVCAEALRRYLLDRGELPEQPLVAYVPKNVRPPGERPAAGNRVVVLLCSLETHVADPVQRTYRIAEGMRQAKAQQDLLGPQVFEDLTGLAVPAAVRLTPLLYDALRLAHLLPPIANVVVSNIPGSPFPLYSLGAPLEAYYPIGPIWDGLGLNLTAVSYVDRLDVGLLSSPRAIPDLTPLAEALGEALARLARAAGVEQPVLVGR